jgi:hypothetical protein
LAFPMTNSAGFSNFPLLLCSVAERNANVFESKHVISGGHWQSGDQFILMSDTVACWFLSQIENGHGSEIISALCAVQSLDAFTALVNHARTTCGADGNVLMRDDDVTMTIVTVGDATSPALTNRLVSTATRPVATSKAVSEAPSPAPIGKVVVEATPAPTSKVVTEAASARNPGAKATGDLPIPSKAKLENRNSAELPPIPQNRSRSPGSPAVDQAARHFADDQRIVAEPPGSHPANKNFTEPSESYDTKKNFAGPPETYDSTKNFAKNARKNSTANRNLILTVGALFVGAVISGVVWFAPHNHQEKPKTEPVGAPNATAIKSDQTTAKQDDKHHKSKWHKSKRLRPVATIAPGRSSSTQPSDQSPALAPNVIPRQSTEPSGAEVSSGSSLPAGSLAPASGSAPDRMPPSAPDRAMVPNPGRSLDRNLDRTAPNIQDRTLSRGADVMPPRAPERIHLPAQNPGNSPEHAPDRMPVHLPDRSLYPALHHPSLGTQHRRSGSSSKAKVVPSDPAAKNDLPENMNAHD